jgi:glucose/arabinose dehydrogenase
MCLQRNTMSKVTMRGLPNHLLLACFVFMLPVPSGWAAAGASVPGDAAQYLFADDLDRPEAFVPLGENSGLVAERSGRVVLLSGTRRVDLGSIHVESMRIFYVPERPYTEGLKDLIAVPGQSDSFLWCMTTGGEDRVRWTVGRARIVTTEDRPRLRQSEILWQSPLQPWVRGSYPPFSGCRMAADGTEVVVAMGANSRAGGSGHVVRISMSGSHEPKVISTGHRNPSGLVFLSGTLWEVEHGPKGGDELNILLPGGDYGWPAVSAGEPDDVFHQTPFLKTRSGSIDPIVVWTPAIAPSGITTLGGKLYLSTLQGANVLELTLKGGHIAHQR